MVKSTETRFQLQKARTSEVRNAFEAFSVRGVEKADVEVQM